MTKKATLIGLIGADIQGSAAPELQMTEGQAHGLWYVYRLIDLTKLGVSPEALPDLLLDPRVAPNFPAGGTRPLCPYPQLSRYKGSGPTNVASSFVCVRSDEGDGGDHDHDDGHGRD